MLLRKTKPVFGAGTVQWAWGLDDYKVPGLKSAAAQQMTRNVLAVLGRSTIVYTGLLIAFAGLIFVAKPVRRLHVAARRDGLIILLALLWGAALWITRRPAAGG